MTRAKARLGSMKKMRIISLILVVCSLALTLSACNSDTITVNSKIFEELEAKEVDIQWLKNHFIAGDVENAYNGPTFSLNERDGVIYLEEWEEEFSHVCNMNYGYLVGIDRGEFGSWVSWCTDALNEDKTVIVSNVERLFDENCVGFLNPKIKEEDEEGIYWLDNINVAYIFTYCVNPDDSEILYKGKIYKLEVTEDGGYKCELFAEFDTAPMAMLIDATVEEENIIVATEQALLSVDQSGKVTELFTSDYWEYLYPTSIVKVDNAYYVGTSSGILKYNIDTDDAVWYPYYDIEE